MSHKGKHFIVHGATCVCNKAEDPTKEAILQVTSHKKVVFNDVKDKYPATEEDTLFDPPVATLESLSLL